MKIADNLNLPGLEGSLQVVEDAIGHRLVEDAQVAVVQDVVLEGLEFHDQLIGHVIDDDRAKVGQAGPGTDAGKLGNGDIHGVIAVRVSVGHRLQLVPGLFGHENTLGGFLDSD